MKPIIPRHCLKHLVLFSLAMLFVPEAVFPGDQAGSRVPTISQAGPYTIKIVHMKGGAFGYEIRNGRQMIVRERRNPFTGSEAGLSSREDALKTATWLANNMLKKEQLLPPNRQLPSGPVSGRLIPAAVARELGISLDERR